LSKKHGLEIMLKRLLGKDSREERVVDGIRNHLRLLYDQCCLLVKLLKDEDVVLIERIMDIEREGDIIRRRVFSELFEGAFIPYMRPHLYRFVEMCDRAMDTVEDVAKYYELAQVPSNLKEPAVSIAEMTSSMAELLLIAYDTFQKGKDLRDQMLAIRVYEKRIDDVDHTIRLEMKNISVTSFWEGWWLGELCRSLSLVSDIIEDAMDVLSLIQVSLR